MSLRLIEGTGIGAIAAIVLLSIGCSTVPTVNGANMIAQACVIDATIRPTVSALLAVHGLANPDEVVAITVARAAIDPICSNPTAPASVNASTILLENIGKVQGIITALEARKSVNK